MSAGNHCAGCGAPLAGQALMGMCPRCLARVCLGAPPASDATQTPTTVGGADAPTTAAPVQHGRIRYMGDYELLEEIAHGAMGVIFRARQLSLDRTVAVKMILSGHFAAPEEVTRFYAEAQAAANLNHPNIVAIYEIGKFERQHYYSMQLVEGRSLHQRLKEFCLPLPDGQSTIGKTAVRQRQVVIARLMVKVARAVHFAHQRGILHRDLKPANIMLDAKDEPLVTDFGLAKRVDSGSDWSRSGDILGTPLYMSPEQAAGKNKQLTTATDTYSLGAILYHLLAGKPPFTGDSSLAILRQIADHEPPRISSLNPRVDRDLETICLKCLEKSPDQRYRSAEELADDLERWLREEPIAARPITRRERALKWSRRNPAIMGVLCTFILLGAIAFQGISWQRWETERVRRWESVRIKAIPVGRTSRQVHLTMNTLGRIRSKDGTTVARMRINYADGLNLELSVIFHTAANASASAIATNQITITQTNSAQPDGWRQLIRRTWLNPRPEIVIESVDFEVLDGRAAPFLVTIVAE